MREDFLLRIWDGKSEEEVAQKDEPFLAIPDTVEMRAISPVSLSETVETAFLEERNKINKNGRDIL